MRSTLNCFWGVETISASIIPNPLKLSTWPFKAYVSFLTPLAKPQVDVSFNGGVISNDKKTSRKIHNLWFLCFPLGKQQCCDNCRTHLPMGTSPGNVAVVLTGRQTPPVCVCLHLSECLQRFARCSHVINSTTFITRDDSGWQLLPIYIRPRVGSPLKMDSRPCLDKTKIQRGVVWTSHLVGRPWRWVRYSREFCSGCVRYHGNTASLLGFVKGVSSRKGLITRGLEYRSAVFFLCTQGEPFVFMGKDAGGSRFQGHHNWYICGGCDCTWKLTYRTYELC